MGLVGLGDVAVLVIRAAEYDVDGVTGLEEKGPFCRVLGWSWWCSPAKNFFFGQFAASVVGWMWLLSFR